MTEGDPCWRDRDGVAALELPFRVVLPDGLTRTNPDEWSQDPEVLAATGWRRDTLTAEDVALLTPPSPASRPAWKTPHGWSLGITPEDVALLTGLYVLALRRSQLGLAAGNCTVIDVDGSPHAMSFSEFETLMLGYGAAVEAAHGTAS